MASERAAAIKMVDDRASFGELASFADWPKLVQHLDDPGEPREEGAEFEGKLDVNETVWVEEGDVAALKVDDLEAAAPEVLTEVP